MILEKYEQYEKIVKKKEAKEKSEKAAEEKRRQERQAKKKLEEELERQKVAGGDEKIKELTEEEAEQLEKELKKVSGYNIPVSSLFVHRPFAKIHQIIQL